MINLKELEKIKREEKIAKLSMIVGLLWNREMYEGEIKQRLRLSIPLISKYLHILKKANIVRITCTEEARGQPRKYHSVDIEAVIKHVKEKYVLQPSEERILVEACERATKAINASPNLMDKTRVNKLHPGLISTYPFIITLTLGELYEVEPNAEDLQRNGFSSSEIKLLQKSYQELLKTFPPALELSADERRWFKNEDNKRLLDQTINKICIDRPIGRLELEILCLECKLMFPHEETQEGELIHIPPKPKPPH